MQAVNDEAIQVENLKIRATLARAVRDTLVQNHLTQIGVLGILPPNTAKTSEAPVFASL